MKVKCKVCGLKGNFELSDVSEYHASRFLFIMIRKHKDFFSDKNSVYICRSCVNGVLDSLRMESYKIENLYKPTIKDKGKK